MHIVSERREGVRLLLLCSDGNEYTMRGLCRHTGLDFRTIKDRKKRYGNNNPIVLYKGALSQAILDLYGIKVVFSKSHTQRKQTKWDRKKCRRDGLNCENYSECQSKRLGIHQEKWIPPEGDNTDLCFIQPDISLLIRRPSDQLADTTYCFSFPDKP